ncbi:hypothetical protein ScPMuIL_009458 [Solemya velum]
MKVRIRLDRITKLLPIDENSGNTTILELQEKVKTIFPDIENTFFQLSLNNKDPIEKVDTKLADLGIVSGDLFYIISEVVEVLSLPETSNQQCDLQKNAFLPTQNNCQLGNRLASAPRPFSHQQGQGQNSEQYPEMKNETQEEISETLQETKLESELMETSEVIETNEECLMKRKLLREPRLCRDSSEDSVPMLLEEMHSAFGVTSACDALVVVQHVLMLEMGFTTVTTQDGASQGETESLDREPLSKQWKMNGCYKIPYTHTGCEDLACFVTSLPMGSVLVVHGFIKGSVSQNAHQLQVKIADYADHISGTTDVSSCYNNLSKLSRLFKDNIGLPLLQDIRTAKGLHCTVGFLGLAHEVKLQVMCYLDHRSVVALSMVCREMYSMSRDPCIWRALYIRQFGSLSRRNALSQDWYELYKSKFKLEKEKREALRHMTFVTPPLGISGRHNPPFPWVPVGPGIIGGDYDLTPNLPGFPMFQGDRQNRQRGPLAPCPRIDPLGPLPDMMSFPGRGRGLHDNRRNLGGMNRQPRFF